MLHTIAVSFDGIVGLNILGLVNYFSVFQIVWVLKITKSHNYLLHICHLSLAYFKWPELGDTLPINSDNREKTLLTKSD